MMVLPTPSRILRGHAADGTARDRTLPEEVAVALCYNGTTMAVMMATPADLVDFATGFTLTERLAPLDEIGEVELVEHATGIEARIWLPPARAAAMTDRRRAMVGPVGCGLCGIDSLEQALRPLPTVAAPSFALSAEDVTLALDELRGWQPLHDETRAVHAAGFYRPGAGIVMAREDVGRHNALDKLIGALARTGIDPQSGAVVLTSRVSVEMVQKCAAAGSAVILAVSSPTAHAVRLAQGAGITVATGTGEHTHLHCHPDRITERGPNVV